MVPGDSNCGLGLQASKLKYKPLCSMSLFSWVTYSFVFVFVVARTLHLQTYRRGNQGKKVCFLIWMHYFRVIVSAREFIACTSLNAGINYTQSQPRLTAFKPLKRNFWKGVLIDHFEKYHNISEIAVWVALNVNLTSPYLLWTICTWCARAIRQFASKKWLYYLTCRLRFCYNCVINKYLRGFDRKLDISDWQSRVASYSSMMRKVERDWKMVSPTTLNYSVQNGTLSLTRQLNKVVTVNTLACEQAIHFWWAKRAA